MNERAKQLKTVFLNILENWAMMLVDEIEESENLFTEMPLYASKVEIDGIFHGLLIIVAPKEFLQNLATNLTGSAEPVTDEESLIDAFKEMGNVMAGNFLTEAYGKDAVFDILQPEVTQITKGDIDKLMKLSNAYLVKADDSPVFVNFELRSK